MGRISQIAYFTTYWYIQKNYWMDFSYYTNSSHYLLTSKYSGCPDQQITTGTHNSNFSTQKMMILARCKEEPRYIYNVGKRFFLAQRGSLEIISLHYVKVISICLCYIFNINLLIVLLLLASWQAQMCSLLSSQHLLNMSMFLILFWGKTHVAGFGNIVI